MDRRRTPRAVVAWSSAAVTGVLEVSALGLVAAADGAGIAGVGPVAGALAVGVMLSAVAVVGALVVGRRPDSPIGWLLLVLAGLASVGSAAEAYGVYSLGNPTAGLPAGAMAAWVSSWILTPSWYAIPGLLLLLFPDGRLPHRRWRWVAWLLVLATLAAVVDAALSPVLDDAPFAGLANPLPAALSTDAVAPLGDFGWPSMPVGLLLAGVAMVGRLRRARGVERRQLRWLAAAAALLPVASLVGVACYFVGLVEIGTVAVTGAAVAIPLTAGYAILRHRLYDVDVVINKAVVYTILTFVLGALYLSSVLLLGVALAPFAADSDVVVAVSTLAVALVFRPARRRVQRLVDRRFHRQRYDAEATLERFGHRLRADVDIGTLSGVVASVLGATMQPAHVSLWQPTGRPADPLWTGGVAPESTVDEGLAAGVAQGLP